MAQWKETLEPYVKVYERVKTATLNPTAGEDLIIGVTLISDAGPAVPTLISSQSEFLKTYASEEITEDYIKSLNKLYKGDDKNTAATMWMNAYRLAGSNTMLVCRAAKANDINFAKPLAKGDLNTYILRDGELLKKLPSFKIVLDIDRDDATHDQDGWSINLNGVGILGNRTTDEGAQYDYYVRTLPDLVAQLNETSKFFSPAYTFYADDKATKPVEVSEDNEASKDGVLSVVFEEVYVGVDLLDTSDPRCPEGHQYVVICEPNWTKENPDQLVISINDPAWSGFEASKNYAINVYNSATPLRLRIRRFNHDAVVSKELSNVSLNENSDSPWMVLTSVLDTFTAKGTKEPSQSVLDRDFYEICVLDPSVSGEPMFYNIGKILGRGDMEESELNNLLSMVQVELPDNLRDLNLNYYGYGADDNVWVEIPADQVQKDEESGNYITSGVAASYEDLLKTNAKVEDIYQVGTDKFYQYKSNGEDQIYADLSIDPEKYRLLDISDSDLKKALDLIAIDEVYVTEGLCDLGNTEPSFQSYMANMAINENYFYPISTVNSTNYMTIANSASRISQDSYKLYMAAPWDIDTGTMGWKYYASPAVIYWETVARNRRNNEEFRGILGQSGGIVQYQRPVTEFNKKTRQLLLSKKINTVKWNMATSAWNMNDNYTKSSEDTIMSDEGNSRLAIRISKAMPVLLRQFIGRKITEKLFQDIKSVIDYWMRTEILSMVYSIDGYFIKCDDETTPDEMKRQNKVKVILNVRYQRSFKCRGFKKKFLIEKYSKLLEAYKVISSLYSRYRFNDYR